MAAMKRTCTEYYVAWNCSIIQFVPWLLMKCCMEWGFCISEQQLESLTCWVTCLPCAKYAQKGYAIGHVYIYVCVYIYIYIYATKLAYFASSGSKNPWKSVNGAFLSHLHIVNVTVDCLFTPGRALLLFLCSRLCTPLGLHTRANWLVGMLLCCWQLQCSKYFTDMQCSVCTGCVLWNSFLYKSAAKHFRYRQIT